MMGEKETRIHHIKFKRLKKKYLPLQAIGSQEAAGNEAEMVY
jgi:hypothetical protein